VDDEKKMARFPDLSGSNAFRLNSNSNSWEMFEISERRTIDDESVAVHGFGAEFAAISRRMDGLHLE
jgi:hypothetical protein